MLVVAAVGGWRYWQHVERTRAEAAAARYQEALRLDQDGKGEESAQILRGLTTDSRRRLSASRPLPARRRDSASATPPRARRPMTRSPPTAAFPPPWQDLARLRAAMLRLDTAEAGAAQPALERIATPTNAWRHTAREMLGLSALKRGDYDVAGRWFDQIAADRETPQALRSRLEIYSALVNAGPAQATQ